MLPPGFPAHSTTTLVVARALGASLCTSAKVQQLPPAVQFYPGKSARMSFINLANSNGGKRAGANSFWKCIVRRETV
jgi:hypothetical protein